MWNQPISKRQRINGTSLYLLTFGPPLFCTDLENVSKQTDDAQFGSLVYV